MHYMFEVWWELVHPIQSYKMISFWGENCFFKISISRERLEQSLPKFRLHWFRVRGNFWLSQKVCIYCGSWHYLLRLILEGVTFHPFPVEWVLKLLCRMIVIDIYVTHFKSHVIICNSFEVIPVWSFWIFDFERLCDLEK